MTSRPTRKRIWRKRITRAILCLLLGAVTTVGVAWGLWWRAVRRLASSTATVTLRTDEGSEWGVGVMLSLGYTHRGIVGSAEPLRSRIPPDRERMDVDEWYIGSAAKRIVEPLADATVAMPELRSESRWNDVPLVRLMVADGWGRVPATPAPPPAPSTSEASGWPWRALWRYTVPPGTTHGDIPTPFTVLYGTPLRLPRLIAWPGFLLDTLFYAAPWWVVLITPGASRRLRRRRRGRCIHCGYDLAGLAADDKATPTCPECGA